MIVLDYGDRRPIYEQIVERLKDLILRGILETNAPLPSVRSLALDLSINPNTIQRAYTELERTGWIYSVRGKGSFVAPGNEAKEARREELIAKMKQLLAEARLLGISDGEVEDIFRDALDVRQSATGTGMKAAGKGSGSAENKTEEDT